MLVPPADGTRLALLGDLFQLDALDLDLLFVALAPDLDERIVSLYTGLQSGRGGGRPSVGSALRLCGGSTLSASDRHRLGVNGALLRHGLVSLEPPACGFLERLVHTPERLVAQLLGDEDPDPALVPLLAPVVVAPDPRAAELAGAIAAGNYVCWVRQQPRASGAAHAAAAFALLELPAISVDLHRLNDGAGLAAVLGPALLEASLRTAGLVVGPVDPVRDREVLAGLTHYRCPLVLVGREPWDPLWSTLVPYVTDAIELPDATRRQLWTEALEAAGSEPVNEVDIPVHRLTPEQIVISTAIALTQASALGRKVAADDLSRAARAHNAGGMDRIIRRVTPALSSGTSCSLRDRTRTSGTSPAGSALPTPSAVPGTCRRAGSLTASPACSPERPGRARPSPPRRSQASSGSTCTSSTSPRWSTSTWVRPRRTSSASSEKPRVSTGCALFRRSRCPLRQAVRCA